MPLSLTDYAARFSLEFVVLGIAMLAVFTNFSLNSHAQAAPTNDQSVIFSFLKNNPQLNNALLTENDTTTIMAPSDQLIPQAQAQTVSGIVLTSAQSTSNTPSQMGDPTGIQGDVAIKPNLVYTQSFTTGISYTIKDGDTMQSLENTYKITEEDFLDANNLESFDDLAVGAVVTLPIDTLPASALPKPKPVSNFVQSQVGKVPLTSAKTPAGFINAVISFIWPTYHNTQSSMPPFVSPDMKTVATITQGFSSVHTGLDISDSRREPVYAAADGFIEIAGYQTNGYGNTILINDGSGFETRYGHATELYVKAGDYVKQGQLIAEQGNTGRTRGATGIHLHFEIIKNGTRVNPLNYVHP